MLLLQVLSMNVKGFLIRTHSTKAHVSSQLFVIITVPRIDKAQNHKRTLLKINYINTGTAFDKKIKIISLHHR